MIGPRTAWREWDRTAPSCIDAPVPACDRRYFEAFFAIYFLFEMLFKLYYTGCKHHFLGAPYCVALTPACRFHHRHAAVHRPRVVRRSVLQPRVLCVRGSALDGEQRIVGMSENAGCNGHRGYSSELHPHALHLCEDFSALASLCDRRCLPTLTAISRRPHRSDGEDSGLAGRTGPPRLVWTRKRPRCDSHQRWPHLRQDRHLHVECVSCWRGVDLRDEFCDVAEHRGPRLGRPDEGREAPPLDEPFLQRASKGAERSPRCSGTSLRSCASESTRRESSRASRPTPRSRRSGRL